MKTYEITMKNFEQVVEQHPLVLLDFWASWCGPCKTFAPVFEEMAKHNEDIFFGKVNTEQATDLAQAFQIRSIPTLIGFKNGGIVFELSGLPPPQALVELLEKLRNAEPPLES